MENQTPKSMRINTGVCKSWSVCRNKDSSTCSMAMKAVFLARAMFPTAGNFRVKILLLLSVKDMLSISLDLSAGAISAIGQAQSQASTGNFLWNILIAFVWASRSRPFLFLTTLRYIAQKRFGSAYVLGKHEDCSSSFFRPILRTWTLPKHSGGNSKKNGWILKTIGTKKRSFMPSIAVWRMLANISLSTFAFLMQTKSSDILTMFCLCQWKVIDSWIQVAIFCV